MSEIKPWRENIGKPEAYMIMCDVLDVLCEKEAIKKAVYERLKQVPSADRPQGEWIRTGRTNIYGGIEVQCSNCNDKVMVQHLEDERYCRHCGADMGMKGADDD